MRPYAPVLERVVNLVTANPKLKYGAALERAIRDLKIEVPEDVRDRILVVAFQVTANGFPTDVEA